MSRSENPAGSYTVRSGAISQPLKVMVLCIMKVPFENEMLPLIGFTGGHLSGPAWQMLWEMNSSCEGFLQHEKESM